MARVVLIPLLSGSLLAQTPPTLFDPLGDPSLVEKGLQSTVPLQVAISAFRSVKIADQRRAEWLRAALTASLSLQPEAEAVRARRAIFDALIRTGTPVPLTELLPHFDQFPPAVIAIAAKNNPREGEDRLPLLLKAEEGRNSIYWYAAVSLVDRKQLVHYLVQQVRFDYAISVQDGDFVPVQIREGPPHGVIGGIVGGIVGAATPYGSVAWPESTIYHIELSGDINELLTSGTWRATYLRAWSPTVHSFPDAQPADPLAWEDHDREVVRVLASIAHCAVCSFDRGDFPNVRGGKATIIWHSAEQARPLLEEAVERYVNECVRMIDALHETTVSESEIRSKVRIRLRDGRRVQTTPIPSVGVGVEFNRCASMQSGSSNGRCVD
jgi:hypothetical protein